jgi:hypothetical protein
LYIKPAPHETRLLLTHHRDELLKAALPGPSQAHPRAAQVLCEGLALWLQRPLSIVLYADDQGSSSALDLCDGFGFGRTTVHYEVDVMDPRLPRRRLGSFRDLRQLELRGVR